MTKEYDSVWVWNAWIANLELHRGSYMSAHVLLNLLNVLGKRHDVKLCRAPYPFSQWVINSWIEAWMQDFIYQMTPTSHFIHYFCSKLSRFPHKKTWLCYEYHCITLCNNMQHFQVHVICTLKWIIFLNAWHYYTLRHDIIWRRKFLQKSDCGHQFLGHLDILKHHEFETIKSVAY